MPLVVALGLALFEAVWFGTNVVHQWGPYWLGWVALPSGCGVIVAMSWRVAADPALPHPARRFWRTFALAMLLIGLGSASAARDALTAPVLPSQRFTTVSLGLYMLGLVVLLWGLLRLPPSVAVTRTAVLRFVLDASMVVVTVGLFAWHFSFRDVDAFVRATGGGTGPALGVVMMGCTAVLAFAKLAIAGAGAVDRKALLLLALGAAVGSVGGSLAPLVVGRPHVHNAQMTLPVTMLVIAFAVDRQRRVSGQPEPVRPARRPFSLIPYLSIAATDVLLLVTRADGEDAFVIVVCAVGLTAIVVGRQILAFYDNARLLRRVDASLLDLREAQRLLAHQATHDSLTGLANRGLFTERVRASLQRPGPVTVVLVDLDDFKAVNDRLGHVVGDRLLMVLADRLRAGVGPDDLVCRLGGDEFALLLHGPSPAGVLTRLATDLERPVRVPPHDLLIRCSAGYASVGAEPRCGATPELAGVDATELLRRADVAMYAAKEGGKGHAVPYSPEHDRRAENDAQLGADLRQGLDRGEFHLLYQPVVSLPDGGVVGVEALVRWRHPSGRIVPPGEFVAAAERTGLIVPLGEWVLRAACRHGCGWLRRHGSSRRWTIAVNISARQLREPGFADAVADVLGETGLPAERLTVEVTETAVFDNEPAVAALVAISGLGVRISLDDFGTGHSSLGLLRSCPVDVLKVDKSFVDDITGSSGEAVIATALIQIADGLRLSAVAEGVETAEQAARLYELGYRLAQGYHFARPMRPERVGPLLAAELSLRAAS